MPIKNLDKFKTSVSRFLDDKLKDDLDTLAANTVDKYLEGIQAEGYKDGLVGSRSKNKANTLYESGGHIHDAAISAVENLGGEVPQTSSAARKYSAYRSYDDVSSSRGTALVRRGNTFRSFRLSIRLPFAVKLENGGTVKPIAPGGRKAGTGLYGKRSNVGIGYLMWADSSGRPKFARSRTFSSPSEGVGALARAIDSTTSLAETLGWQRK